MKYLIRFILVLAILLLIVFVGAVVAYRVLDWEQSELTDTIRTKSMSSFVTLSDGVTEYEIAGPDSGQIDSVNPAILGFLAGLQSGGSSSENDRSDGSK